MGSGVLRSSPTFPGKRKSSATARHGSGRPSRRSAGTRRRRVLDLAGWDEKPAKTLTFSSLFPLILDDLDPRKATRLIDEHLLNEREFWLPYPVPSVAATEPSFDPAWRTNTTWRGPTWINVNWYLYWGLRAHGRNDVASDLAERTIRMMAASGVREFYDPLTGEGQGARDFGWSTLVLDLIAAERGPA